MTEAVEGAIAPTAGVRVLQDALDALPDAVTVLDEDWTVLHVNRAAAAMLGRPPEDLLDRSIWTAMPELGGSIFHSFLLHARSADERVTWRGYFAPVGRWLEASALRVDDLLHVSARATVPARPDGEGGSGGSTADGDADRERLRLLAEVSEAMISTLDSGESVTRLLELVVPRLGDWALVTTTDDDGRPVERARHVDARRQRDLEDYLRLRGVPENADSPVVAALLTGEPVQADTIDPADLEAALVSDEVRALWERVGGESYTIVPLRTRSETFGAMTLVNRAGRPPHTETEVATAVEVARRAAIALDNARLYARQLQVAETLQRSLLTPPPQPDDLEVEVRYQPAASNMQVGGDWYDAFQQADGATLLVIGDVVGHNVDAAAAMGQVRSILRGIAYDRQDTPAGVLARVDEVLAGLHIGTLATALVARLEQPPERAGSGVRTLRWSSAGHLPPLVVRSDGRVEVLQTPPDVLLGAQPDRARHDAEAEVCAGDTIVFYTDGLVEHGRTPIDDGIDRLVATVSDLRDLPLPELCDRLLDRIVHDRSNAGPDDDVALVAVRCHPQDGGAR